jgi:hypothetical protein
MQVVAFDDFEGVSSTFFRETAFWFPFVNVFTLPFRPFQATLKALYLLLETPFRALNTSSGSFVAHKGNIGTKRHGQHSRVRCVFLRTPTATCVCSSPLSSSGKTTCELHNCTLTTFHPRSHSVIQHQCGSITSRRLGLSNV